MQQQMGMQDDTATLETVSQFPTMLNVYLSYNPAIPLQGIYWWINLCSKCCMFIHNL